mmetsp:Transcript_70318/g.131537  ORF Transcript_70318/g.131537 Transcript_70318/m.131537 type:complete len:220 (+) Transcript_70318:1129-1788(+)
MSMGTVLSQALKASCKSSLSLNLRCERSRMLVNGCSESLVTISTNSFATSDRYKLSFSRTKQFPRRLKKSSIRSRTGSLVLFITCKKRTCLARTSAWDSCRNSLNGCCFNDVFLPSICRRRRATVFNTCRRSAAPAIKILMGPSFSPGKGHGVGSFLPLLPVSGKRSGGGSYFGGSCCPCDVPTAAGPKAAAWVSPSRSNAGELPQNCKKPIASVPSDA